MVEAVYCAPGEFSRPSPGVARVRVAEHCAVTFVLDAAPGPGGPQLSVELELLTRSHNELFAQVPAGAPLHSLCSSSRLRIYRVSQNIGPTPTLFLSFSWVLEPVQRNF